MNSTRIVLGIIVLAFAAARLGSCALLPDKNASLAVPVGNAAWIYPETLQQINAWAANLTAYNTAAGKQRAVRVLYVYSMDLYITNLNPVMGSLLLTAVNTFRKIPYVTHVGAIIDGYYTTSDYSDGDFNSISADTRQKLADAYARLYCSVAAASLDGIQLDLEPYAGKYQAAMLDLVRRLSTKLRNTSFCPSPAGKGKFLSFFVGPRQATTDLYAALGPNGYAIISGYDLDSPGPGQAETPAVYATNLQSCWNFVKNQSAFAAKVNSYTGRYSMGLPFAASACEFQQAISVTNPSKTIAGYPMYSASSPTNSYIPRAFAVLNATLGSGYDTTTSPYLGVTMWGFLSRDVKVSGYKHVPKGPFDTPEVMSYLQKSMPMKQ